MDRFRKLELRRVKHKSVEMVLLPGQAIHAIFYDPHVTL